MLNGLDLFSGIGGLTLALSPWVKPVAYCEKDKYGQSVLLSNMHSEAIPFAPIWDDVCTLHDVDLPEIDIIYAGFPCQDISVAGTGKGLEGERSGLFFEVLRLTSDLRPPFVFLENVPAIRTRGAETVIGSMAQIGYDARWITLSASDVGAPHIRERWWCLLANTDCIGLRHQQKYQFRSSSEAELINDGSQGSVDDNPESRGREKVEEVLVGRSEKDADPFGDSWWSAEPRMDRVAHDVPHRMDRIKSLGNAVVPAQAREAFKRLTGLKEV